MVALSERGPEIDLELCTGCGDCAAVCPLGGIVVVEGKALLPEGTTCDVCGDCEVVCPNGAIGVAYEVAYEEPQGSENRETVIE